MSDIASGLRRWHEDPVAFVRDVLRVEPDAWQRDALAAVATKPRVAMSACKGPGKSALLAWVGWWALATRPGLKAVALSITADNLRDGLWTEFAMWRSKSPLLVSAFTWGAERIASVDSPETWWMSARAFARQADATQQANTLAGLHGERVLVLLDEVGDYPHGVVSAAEGIFANATDARLVAAGNPTSRLGPLYQMTRDPAWHPIRITGDPDDPKRSPRIDLAWARGEIARWGRDNPWVQVNVLGEFPARASNQLISDEWVDAAQARDVPILSVRSDAIVWGLDPARFGSDEACLMRRQGTIARRALVWRGLDGTDLGDQVAHRILEAERDAEPPDTIFVDVGGVGASCYDRLKALGHGDIVQPVDFGGSPSDDRYLNKRVEMWDLVAQWLKRMPACLPTDPQLKAELVAPTYRYGTASKSSRLILESKDDLKARGVASPNRADALALTFAGPVASRSQLARAATHSTTHALTEYNPFAR